MAKAVANLLSEVHCLTPHCIGPAHSQVKALEASVDELRFGVRGPVPEKFNPRLLPESVRHLASFELELLPKCDVLDYCNRLNFAVLADAIFDLFPSLVPLG